MKRIFQTLQMAIVHFYSHFPALYSGLYFLIGVSAAFHSFFFITGMLFFTIERRLFFLLLIAAGFFYTKAFHPFPDLEEKTYGNGIFRFETLRRFKTPFTTQIACDGTLLTFQTKTKTYHRLPCRLYFSLHENRLQENQNYLVDHCLLIRSPSGKFILKTTKKTHWKALEKNFSHAKWRFNLKEKVRCFVKKSFKNKHVIALISTLITGDRENRLITYHFTLVGLTHLLTISGFHFALLACFFSSFFRLFLSRKQTGLLLIFLLSLYFFYMGPAPSMNRAFIGILLFLLAPFFHRTYNALNALGIGLIGALISNPSIVREIGFQLSFSATLAIFLFYSSFERSLQKIFKKRPFSQVQMLCFKDQIGTILSHYLRKVLALNGALMTLTLPIFLFHFHHFPLMSLFYNLFYPLFFSLMLFLLLISFLLPLLRPVLEFYLIFLIDLVLYVPKKFLFSCHFPKIPIAGAFCWFFFFLFFGIYLKWSLSTIKQGSILKES